MRAAGRSWLKNTVSFFRANRTHFVLSLCLRGSVHTMPSSLSQPWPPLFYTASQCNCFEVAMNYSKPISFKHFTATFQQSSEQVHCELFLLVDCASSQSFSAPFWQICDLIHHSVLEMLDISDCCSYTCMTSHTENNVLLFQRSLALQCHFHTFWLQKLNEDNDWCSSLQSQLIYTCSWQYHAENWYPLVFLAVVSEESCHRAPCSVFWWKNHDSFGLDFLVSETTLVILGS